MTSTPLRPADLLALADLPRPESSARPERLFSIWEITRWILPMAPEHLRRVLAARPDLPQGAAGAEGGTRWFTADEVAALRRHFATGARGGRFRAPARDRAPVVTLARPAGRGGGSTALAHLAVAAGLAGWRVLVIDGDPAGGLTAMLGAATRGGGVAALLARAAGTPLRAANARRLDLGEPPLPMDEAMARLAAEETAALLSASRWPGVTLLPAGPDLMLAEMRLAGWRMAQRGWQPWRALAEALRAPDLAGQHDLILCDPGRGLGALALAQLLSADLLLAPLLPGEAPAAVLAPLARAALLAEAEAGMTARALGQPTAAFGWAGLALLPVRQGTGTGFAAKPLPPDALPGLPEIPGLGPGAATLYDLDYRALGRVDYAPLRDACEASWAGLAAQIAGLPAEGTLL